MKRKLAISFVVVIILFLGIFKPRSVEAAVPTFVSAGAIDADTAGGCAITPAPPTHQADDIIIVTAYNDAGGTLSTVTAGWTEITEVDGGTNIAWYWKRATGAGTAGPDITSASTDCFGVAYIIRGAITSGTPYEDATTSGNGTTADATPDTATITTTGLDEFAVAFLGKNDDAVWSSNNPPSTWTADSNLYENAGTDNAFNVISKTQATPGDVTTVAIGSLSVGEAYGALTLAFIPPGVTLSGNVYTGEGTGNMGANKTVDVRIGGVGTYTDETDSSGIWSIANIPVDSGDIVTAYLDDETEEGTTVYKSDGAADSAINIYQNYVIVRDDTGTPITPDSLFTGDDGDDDVKYVVSASSNGNLTVDTDFHFFVGQNTFDASGGTVTTQTGAGARGNFKVDDNSIAILDTATNTIALDLLVDGNATARLNGSTNINGGDITTAGTSATVTTTSGTPTVTMSGTGSIGGGTTPTLTFYNLATTGTGTTTISNAATINNNLSVGGTSATLIVGATTTVGVDASVASGTTLQNTASLTVTGDIAVTGKLTISSTLTINGGDLTTSGTGVSGVSINYTSTLTTTIASASEAHTLGGGTGTITFFNLKMTGTSQTTTLSTNNIVIEGGLEVGSSHTFAMGTNSLTIGSTANSDSGDILMNTSSSTSQSASGTVTILGNSNAADWLGPGTFTAYNLTIGNGSATMTVDNETGDMPIDVNNTFTNTANATFQASSTGSFTVGGEWSNNSSAVFTANSGTVKMDGTSGSKTITSGGDAFYNLSIDNGGTTLDFELTDELDVNGSLLIDTNNTLINAAFQVNVAGNWTNNGSYSGNNTTVFDGAVDTTQTIDGNTTFYNLTATTGDRVLIFDDADTFTIAASGTFTATGDSCTALVVIRSDSKGNPFDITKTGDTTFSYTDIQDVTLSASDTAANSVDSGGNSNFTIAANACVSASTDSSAIATGFSFQRKTFYDSENSRHWLFVHDGDEIEARYSSDGSSWSLPSTAASAHFAYDTNDFSVWWSSISTTEYVWLAVASGNDILVRRGTLSTTDITWDSDVITAMNGSGASDDYSYPYFSLDSSNYMWMGARYYNGTNYVYKAVRSDVNDTGDATWDTGIGFGTTVTEKQLSDDQTNANVFGNIVPLASQDMYATFVVNTAIEGCVWDHSDSAWEDSAGSATCSVTTGGAGDTEGSATRGTGGVKIDDAGNPGALPDATSQIVQASDGTLYSFINDGGSCEIWYSTDGSSWLEADENNNPTCTASTESLAIDSDDLLHFAYNSAADVIKHNTMSTSDKLFDSSVTAFTASGGFAIESNLVIDANNKAHLVAEDADDGVVLSIVKYTNNISGSWKSPVTVEDPSPDSALIGIDAVINEDNIIEISYVNEVDDDVTAALGNLNDATSFSIQDVDASVTTSDSNSGSSIGVDSDGNTWIGYINENGATDLPFLVKHNDSDAWTTWQTPTSGSITAGGEPSISIIGKTIFMSYEYDPGTSDDIAYDIYDSGTDRWNSENILATGTFQDAKIRYSKYNFHEPWLMDVLYSDGTDIYWSYIDLRATNIDNGSDFGTLPESTRQMVRTKAGDLYAFINDGGQCEMWKSSDGYAWEQQATGTTVLCDTFDSQAAAIDNNQDIHVLYTSSAQVIYRNFDTATDAWDGAGATTVFTETGGIGGRDILEVAITVDSSSVPHAAFITFYDTSVSDTANVIYYSNRVGGSWDGSPTSIDSVGNIDINDVDIAMDLDNKPEILYNNLETALTVVRGNQNDASSFTDTKAIDSTLGDGSSLAVDTLTGNTWVAYQDSDSDVTLAKHAYADGWTTWSSIESKNEDGTEPSIAIAGSSDIYVFYQDAESDQNISYDVYDSDAGSPAWDGETDLHGITGDDLQDVKAKGSFEWNNYGANKIDYLFSDGTDVYWDYLYVRQSPTNIDNASDFGALPQTTSQILRTSGGILYALVNDAGSCEVWRSADGVSWSELDSVDNPGCFYASESGKSPLVGAVDSQNIIHLAFFSSDGGNTTYTYMQFDTVTDQFSTATGIQTVDDTTITSGISVTVDFSDIPHIVYSGAADSGTTSFVRYNNRIGGSWNGSPVSVEAVNSAFANSVLSLTINEDDIPEVTYLNSVDDDLTAAVGNANDATSFTLQDVDGSVNDTTAVRGASISVDSSGNTWISYVDSDGFLNLAKHLDASAWSSWETLIETSNTANEPSIAIDSSNVYVFYEDDQDDIVFDKYNGSSWSGETLLEEHGALQDVNTRWSYINNYDSTGVAPVQTNTYIFDNSDSCAAGAGCQDPQSVWTNDANLFDGESVTNNATSPTAGSASTNYLRGDGTNAPASGGTITSVKARVKGSYVVGTTTVNAAIFSSSENLGAPSVTAGSATWSSYTTLSAPTGGWTWSAIQALSARAYVTSPTGTGLAWGVEVLVQSTNSTSQNEFDYVYSDGTDVFYNRFLPGGATSGTQDSIATTTVSDATRQYSISTVSDATTPNDVHLLYLDNSATAKVLYKRWDNNGASSAWQAAATVEDTGSTTYKNVSLTIDTSSKDLWAAFVDQTSDDDVYYVRCDVESTTDECDASAEWDTNPTSESTSTGAVYNSLTTNYSSAGNVFGIWTNTSATPFAVSWSSINAVSGNTAPSAPTTMYTNETETGASAGVANPVGVGDSTPIFSSVYADSDVGDIADKYEIIVYSDAGCTVQVWDSGSNGTSMTSCTQGNRCLNGLAGFEFGGTDLPFDGTKYYWKMKYWDDAPSAGSFSDCSDNFTMLSPADQLKHGNYFFNQSTERKFTW